MACVAAASSAAAASRPPTAKEPIWASVDAAAAEQPEFLKLQTKENRGFCGSENLVFLQN